jgi:TrmH family RNA methyltransferase
MRIISSRANQEITQVHALKQSKERAHAQQFIAEGLRVCQTLLEHGTPIYMLYATEAQLADTQDMLIRTKSAAPITLVSDSVMEKISTVSTPSGILGVFAIPNKINNKINSTQKINSGLVLAQITDPGNMGTLIRTAVAVGVKNIFVVEGVDPWSPKVVHASAGTIGGATIMQLSWPELVALKGETPLCALVVRGGQPLISAQPSADQKTLVTRNNLLVVGNESRGIPDAWLKNCEQLVTLPMPGGTESLNAAVAGSIALYLLHVCPE